MSPSVRLELQVAGPADGLPGRRAIREWLHAAVAAAQPGDSGVREIVVRIVGEEESRELNQRFRQQDKATNVLAFPAAAAGASSMPGADCVLGDLVLCGTVIVREAAEQGKDAAAHWAHMLVHGALHLLGYDHQAGPDAVHMESTETRILAARGIDDPYAPR